MNERRGVLRHRCGRLPWLTINLGTVLLAGCVLSLFQSTLDSLTILAVFLPVVMGQAGIAGTQTLTIIVRSIALGELPTSDTRGVLLTEMVLAIGQGLVVSAILVGIVWAWRGDSYLALVVAGALLLNMLVAALGGVLVPLAAARGSNRPRHVVSRIRHNAHRRLRHRPLPGPRHGHAVGSEAGLGGYLRIAPRVRFVVITELDPGQPIIAPQCLWVPACAGTPYGVGPGSAD